MPTFKEFLRVAELSVKDKTSGSRMMEMQSILRKHKIFKGLTPEKAVAILEDLGPTYVKIGQIMSNRADLLPREYCDALAALRANVAPIDFDEVLALIDSSYGRSWREVFDVLQKDPLGSASIAQVHKGYLEDGSAVAVKVKRPGIEQQMAEDIALLRHALAIAEFTTTNNRNMVTLDELLNELEKTTSDELDFSIEMNNLLRFYDDIEDQEDISSPLPYPEYSTEDVLVMEFVEGTMLDDIDKEEADKDELSDIGERLAQSYVTQVIDNGFFHADPHPGNIVISEEEIFWVDLGMTGTLTKKERKLVGNVCEAIALNDPFLLKDTLLALSASKGEIDHSLLLEQMENMLNSYATDDLSNINIGTALMDVIDILRSNDLSLPSTFTMLARGLVTLEGVVSSIAPTTSVVDIVTEHVQEKMYSYDSLKERAKRDVLSGIESAEATVRLPKQVSNMLDMLNKGQLKVTTDMKVADNIRVTLYSIGGSVALAMISAGLFIGSSLLCLSNMEPQLLGVPVLGVLGYCGAFILGVYVIWRTWTIRHRQRNNEKME